MQVNSSIAGAVDNFVMGKGRYMHVSRNVKLVATIGLSVAGASFLGLLLVLISVGGKQGVGYGQIIASFALTRQSLGSAMLIFGLAMVGFAGIITWLLSLYASFRVAGPLYRISRDLEQQIDRGLIAPVPIRATDSLQREWKEFEASVAALRAQREELRQAMDEVDEAVGEQAVTASVAPLMQTIDRLKEVAQRVRL